MRKIALLGASALVLALGVASASAEPTTAQIMKQDQTGTYQTYAPNAPSATVHEGRAAAFEGSAINPVITQPRGVR
jgi:ABC-type glycerol-3-phosphate transport system substrate-binding protein